MDLTPTNTPGLNGGGAVGTPTSTGYGGSGGLGDSMATPTGALAYTPGSSFMSIASSTLQTPSSQHSIQPLPFSQRPTKCMPNAVYLELDNESNISMACKICISSFPVHAPRY